MTDTELHVHGDKSEKVCDLVRRLSEIGFEVSHCVGMSTEPIVVGPNGEQFKGADIENTFFAV